MRARCRSVAPSLRDGAMTQKGWSKHIQESTAMLGLEFVCLVCVLRVRLCVCVLPRFLGRPCRIGSYEVGERAGDAPPRRDPETETGCSRRVFETGTAVRRTDTQDWPWIRDESLSAGGLLESRTWTEGRRGAWREGP